LEEDVMSRVERFRIKNAMIIANLISNVIGVALVILLGRISTYNVSDELLQLMERTNLWFIPPSMLLPLILSLIYERPIRKHFEDLFGGRTSTPEATLAARRRLLNEPFFLILIDFSMWVAGAFSPDSSLSPSLSSSWSSCSKGVWCLTYSPQADFM
jgi:hypothetical protein